MYTFTFWLIMVLLAIDGCIITILNYKFNDRKWYMPLMFICCNGLTGMWTWLMRTINAGDKNEIFISGLIWDVVLSGACTALPLLLFGVKLNWQTISGAILISIGLLIVKLYGN